MSRSYRIFSAAVAIAMIFFISMYFTNGSSDIDVNHCRHTYGKILSASPPGRNRGFSTSAIRYTFSVGEKVYDDVDHCDTALNGETCTNLVGQYFPVVYDPANPSKNRLLFKPREQLQYHLFQPDTTR